MVFAKDMRRVQKSISLPVLVLLAFLLPVFAVCAEDEELWRGLQEGRSVALIRHALAPGTGDPPGFELGDCSTQRTLSEEGRRQAKELGDLFRSQGLDQAEVRSSRWCRCLETAELLNLGEVRKTSFLDSFFGQREKGPEQTEAAREVIREHLDQGGGPLVMVTHQVNITALSGVYPASGEIVVLSLDPEDSSLKVDGRLRHEF